MMPSPFEVALLLWSVAYLLLPLRVWLRVRIPAGYHLETVSADELFSTSEDAPEVRRWLVRMGFEELACARMPGKPSRVAFALYCLPGDASAAVLATAESGSHAACYLEFTQSFVDGSRLVVNSNPLPGVYPALPGKQVWRYPDRSPAELHSAFLHLRDRCRARPVPTLDPAQPLLAVEDALARESRLLVEAGCLVDPPGPDGHHLRLPAAYAFSWRMLWPVKGLRDRWQRIAARRALDAT